MIMNQSEKGWRLATKPDTGPDILEKMTCIMMNKNSKTLFNYYDNI